MSGNVGVFVRPMLVTLLFFLRIILIFYKSCIGYYDFENFLSFCCLMLLKVRSPMFFLNDNIIFMLKLLFLQYKYK